MAKTDNRVRYTKMVLQEAILKILQNKPIDKVTVKEICDEAEINRGTFYLHYSTPYDLLKEIENNFIEEHLAFFSPYLQDVRNTNLLENMFTCFFQNRELCRILMGRNGDPQMLRSLKAMMRDGILDEWQTEFPHYDRDKLSFVYDFVFAGAMTVILDWLEDESIVSIDDLARRLDRLGHYCHLAIKEF